MTDVFRVVDVWAVAGADDFRSAVLVADVNVDADAYDYDTDGDSDAIRTLAPMTMGAPTTMPMLLGITATTRRLCRL